MYESGNKEYNIGSAEYAGSSSAEYRITESYSPAADSYVSFSKAANSSAGCARGCNPCYNCKG